MTVGELMAELEKFPKDSAISFNYKYGTDYGEEEGEYGYDPGFKFWDTLKILDINLF